MGKHYVQLSIEERTMIQTQLEMGIKPAAIALGLNRSASTLSRALSRYGCINNGKQWVCKQWGLACITA